MSYIRVAGLIMGLTVLPGAVSLAFGGGIATSSAGGVSGSTSRTTVPPPPSRPVITEFNCAEEANGYWSFWGQVAGPAGVEELTIEFDGIPSINGKAVTVNPDGSFSITVLLQPNETGAVGATLMDDNGTEYDEAETLVT